MMKIGLLISIFILLACSQKITYQEIPLNLQEDIIVKRIPQNVSTRYQSEMDIMVAFLWPKSLNTEDSKNRAVNILSLARSLKDDNELLLSTNKKFDSLRCTEVMTGEITVEIEIEDQCYEMEELKNELTFKLYQKVYKIKEDVIAIKGIWFDNHRDFDALPLPTVNFNANIINFTAIGSYKEDGKPIEYFNIPFELKRTKDFYTLYFDMTRKNENGLNDNYGYFTGKVNILPLKNSIVYQGEFNWHYNGDTQEGVIYWQNIAN